MSATGKGDLAGRLDAVVEEARGRVEAFQSEAAATQQGIRDRFREFLPLADRVVAIAREKLDQLRERLQFEVVPSHVQTDRLYSRSVTLDVKSELAGVIRLSFRLTHDTEVRNLLLDYTLEIVPVFLRFNPHARLEMPLESFDEAAVGEWFDDCLVEFANTYLEIHSTRQYQERVLVSDPVAGISFPKYFAAATLDHDGTTRYFISEQTRGEYAKRHGLAP